MTIQKLNYSPAYGVVWRKPPAFYLNVGHLKAGFCFIPKLSIMIKNFIKNEEKLISLVNELINDHDTPKELAKTLDDLIFDYIAYFFDAGDCGSSHYANQILNLKGIRDFLFEIE